MGNMTTHGPSRSVRGADPSRIIFPQENPSETDSPRYANAPSATMVTAMPSRARALIGISTFGSSSRSIIRVCVAPSTRDACTNSLSANTRVAARASRPTGAIDNTPSVMHTTLRLLPSAAMIRRANTRPGKESRAKNANEMTRSAVPLK